MIALRYAGAVLLVALATAAELGTKPPLLHGETLDGQNILLPDAALGKVTLVVIGVSKAGGQRTGAWKDRFVADFGANPHTTYYVGALLQGAPSLIRGMIRSSMRSGTPVPERRHVFTSASDEDAWKGYLAIKDESLPGVLLLDEQGRLLWSYDGAMEPDRYQGLKAAITAALNHH